MILMFLEWLIGNHKIAYAALFTISVIFGLGFYGLFFFACFSLGFWIVRVSDTILDGVISKIKKGFSEPPKGG